MVYPFFALANTSSMVPANRKACLLYTSSAFNNLGNLVAQSAVNLFGEATMAGYTAASRIGTLALMPMVSTGIKSSVPMRLAAG